jgi:hypothetical protein
LSRGMEKILEELHGAGGIALSWRTSHRFL